MMFGFYRTKFVKTLFQELSILKSDIESAVRFIESIEQNNWSAEYNSKGEPSALSVALTRLREKHNQVRVKEEEQIWVANGLANFSQLLRNDQLSIDEMASKIISQLTKYVGANQGGLFLVKDSDEENVFLELKGLYAYGRKKYEVKKIDLSEGLLGQCYLEGTYIHMTEVPSNFIKITSGLGEATPRCILLVPLKIDEKKVGVIEFAFFDLIRPIQIEFLTKVSENIASLFVRIKENDRVIKLLEQSEVLAKKLQSREEQLNQNLEEMNSIQNELNRQNKELLTAQANLQHKHKELESLKGQEAELLESKLKAQDLINQTIIKQLQKKLSQLELEKSVVNLN